MPTTSLYQLFTAALAGRESVVPVLLMLVKVTCLLGAAWAVSLMLRRASAGSRHLVWLVSLGALLLLPALAAWSPLSLRVLPAELASAPVTLAPPVAPSPAPLDDKVVQRSTTAPSGDVAANSAAPSGTPSAGRSFSMADVGLTLLGVWGAVAVALCGWLLYGMYSVRRIVRRAAVLQQPEWQGPLYEIADRLGLEAAPTLLRSEDVHMPFACGLVHCTIVLPAESDGWSAEQRTAVLIHELGHVRRRDLIGHTLGRIACAIYWFHPMVWSAARRLRDESERACDDLALTFGARPSEYAEHLLDIVTAVRHHATPSVALAMAHRKEFEGRMLAILDPQLRRENLSRAQRVAVIGVLAFVSVVVGAAAPAPRLAPIANGEQTAMDDATQATPPSPRTPVVGALGDRPARAALPADDTSRARRNGVLGDAIGEAVRRIADTETRTTVHTALNSAINTATSTAVNTAMDVLFGDGKGSKGYKGDKGDKGSKDVPEGDRADVLAKVLRTDADGSVRRVAAWGLQRYTKTQVAIDALIGALGRDGDADVRRMAAWALESADNTPEVIRSLTLASRQDKSDDVRETAVWALGNYHRDAAIVATLGQVLEHDASSDVRSTAAWALGHLEAEKAPKGLILALADADDDVRYKAAWALSEIGDAAALPALRVAIRKEREVNVIRAMLRGLIVAGENPESLSDMLTSQYPEVRAAAISAIAGKSGIGPWPWPWPRPIPMP